VIAWGDNFLADATKLMRVSAAIAAGSCGCEKSGDGFIGDSANRSIE
jgi:hypothetical protein